MENGMRSPSSQAINWDEKRKEAVDVEGISDEVSLLTQDTFLDEVDLTSESEDELDSNLKAFNVRQHRWKKMSMKEREVIRRYAYDMSDLKADESWLNEIDKDFVTDPNYAVQEHEFQDLYMNYVLGKRDRLQAAIDIRKKAEDRVRRQKEARERKAAKIAAAKAAEIERIKNMSPRVVLSPLPSLQSSSSFPLSDSVPSPKPAIPPLRISATLPLSNFPEAPYSNSVDNRIENSVLPATPPSSVSSPHQSPVLPQEHYEAPLPYQPTQYQSPLSPSSLPPAPPPPLILKLPVPSQDSPSNGFPSDVVSPPDAEKRKKKKQKNDSNKKAVKKASIPARVLRKRRKAFSAMGRKGVPKAAKVRNSIRKEGIHNCKKMSRMCMNVRRQQAFLSQRVSNSSQSVMKRLTKEMLASWKKASKEDRETRKKADKEAVEKRKQNIDFIEAKRQQMKLNFLITQTELYSHFLSRKLGAECDATEEDDQKLLSELDQEGAREIGCDSERVMSNVAEAFERDLQTRQAFDDEKLPSVTSSRKIEDSRKEGVEQNLDEVPKAKFPRPMEHPQPSIFQGELKSYQLKGMNWLISLYDQGINGILADEMGLGKTVQSLAFFAHIAEKYGIWGPFLVIAPASTLHNWEQEFKKFLPSFKVVPYWGTPAERKVLRQYWTSSPGDLHTKDASFHVLITSYQIVITDSKYFNRVKWQYVTLDEAQAIKSITSLRWKTLLDFQCRNRTLLSGTPIQNSMAELWALLHFIMPSLFDSHAEFNEWFSKDIEGENRANVDAKHLQRLHMILKPFLLRRLKKDVEHELSDKVEIVVDCPLSKKQQRMYSLMKDRIKLEDLIEESGGTGRSSNLGSSRLMNLVMQFRKICNHPDLFDRKDVTSPLFCGLPDYNLPKLLFRESLSIVFGSLIHLIYSRVTPFSPDYVHHSLLGGGSSLFSFLPFVSLSPWELCLVVLGNVFQRFFALLVSREISLKTYYAHLIHQKEETRSLLLLREKSQFTYASLKVVPGRLQNLVFTKTKTDFFAHLPHPADSTGEIADENIHLKDEYFPHIPRAPVVHDCMPTGVPDFYFCLTDKVIAYRVGLRCYDPSAITEFTRAENLGSVQTRSFCLEGVPKEREIRNAYRAGRLFHPAVFASTHDELKPLGPRGWSPILTTDKADLICHSGKMLVLDELLTRLKAEGHRVLIYSQMTKMIDLLEEFLYFRRHQYVRLDGSSRIAERRDMVDNFQQRSDIFAFLLSTRAGGLGINLTAADTWFRAPGETAGEDEVIFYDSDWNPTVDQQAMDRAHRLGQTKQVTVYRLICPGSVEARIMQRAKEKSEIQDMVISGGVLMPQTDAQLKPTEVVSLLLDDEEMERKYNQKQAEKRAQEAQRKRAREQEIKKKNTARLGESVSDSSKGSAQVDKEDDMEVTPVISTERSSKDTPLSPPTKRLKYSAPSSEKRSRKLIVSPSLHPSVNGVEFDDDFDNIQNQKPKSRTLSRGSGVKRGKISADPLAPVEQEPEQKEVEQEPKSISISKTEKFETVTEKRNPIILKIKTPEVLNMKPSEPLITAKSSPVQESVMAASETSPRVDIKVEPTIISRSGRRVIKKTFGDDIVLTPPSRRTPRADRDSPLSPKFSPLRTNGVMSPHVEDSRKQIHMELGTMESCSPRNGKLITKIVKLKDAVVTPVQVSSPSAKPKHSQKKSKKSKLKKQTSNKVPSYAKYDSKEDSVKEDGKTESFAVALETTNDFTSRPTIMNDNHVEGKKFDSGCVAMDESTVKTSQRSVKSQENSRKRKRDSDEEIGEIHDTVSEEVDKLRPPPVRLGVPLHKKHKYARSGRSITPSMFLSGFSVLGGEKVEEEKSASQAPSPPPQPPPLKSASQKKHQYGKSGRSIVCHISEEKLPVLQVESSVQEGDTSGISVRRRKSRPDYRKMNSQLKME
ncbi:unnamed protein product [Cyprideis torosa]|uniref:Chromatin-remodeling ATPase INO80 n=1 Tax=Cyprideis torosa TaxID=163714 RepID=A0A7R8W5P4_9CRUS|nr:unnamed protein product [Cyprideis torosa]CAG0884543.1 unnamed protein product [Cyprideis torosa]